MYSSFKKHQLITESWRKFINESEQKKSNIDAVSYLNDLLSDTHASGRSIPDGFNSLNEDDETTASELVSLLTPEFLKEFLIKHEKTGVYDPISIGDILNSSMPEIEKAKQIAVYNSIIYLQQEMLRQSEIQKVLMRQDHRRFPIKENTL